MNSKVTDRIFGVRDHYIFLIALILNITFIVIANYCGVGLTYDSNLYLEIASQLNSKGVLEVDGFLIKPPIYPMILSVIGYKGVIWLNIICLIGSLWMYFKMSGFISEEILKVIYILLISFSTSLIMVHGFVWTEPVFILSLSGIFYVWMKARTPTRWNLIVICGLWLLLPFIRYVGVLILIPAFLIALWKSNYLLRGALFIIGTIVTACIGIWVVLFSSGFEARLSEWITPFQRLDFSHYIDNSLSYLKALGIWVVPLSLNDSIVYVGGSFLLILLLLLIRDQKVLKSKVGITLVIFLTYYFILHTFFFVEYYSAERYLTPFYPILIFVLLAVIDQKFVSWAKWKKNVVMIILGLEVLYGVSRTLKNVIFWNEVRCEDNYSLNLPASETPLIYLPLAEIQY